MDKVKSTRKPKEKKPESSNSNIDVVIFENTEKELEDTIETVETITNTNINIEDPKEKKERKKREPKAKVEKEDKEPKPIKEKKKTKAELLKEEKELEKLRIDTLSNTLSNTLEQETHKTDDNQPTQKNNLVVDKVQEGNHQVVLESPIKQEVKIYEYSTHIQKLYHFSDLHIQLYKRHEEYQEVFNNLLTYLKNEKKKYTIPETTNKNIPIIALITGDILHSKSDLSPECVQLTYNFLKAVSNLMPLVIIPGNHDVNMNNKERLDALTPIIADLPKSNPIYYFLESGVYQLSNLFFYHASIFDNNIIPPITTKQHNTQSTSSTPITTNIMLYHGRVNGAVLFNGLELTEENNKTITPSAFADYDITCLGDIHKHQFITPTIAYAGSLIQQNLGEDIKNHGLIKWDIDSRKGEFIEIQNTWSYVTLYVDNKKANHQCYIKNDINHNTKDNTHDPNCSLSHNIRVRILYKNTPESFISDYITLLKMNHTVHEFSYQNDEFLESPYESQSNTNNDTTNENQLTESNTQTTDSKTQNAKSLSSSTQIDITSPDLQNKYIKEYIKENMKDSDLTITDEDINDIMELNITQNKKLQDISTNYNSIYSANKFSGHYKLKRLEFSNLFAFGLNNVIDFTHFKGVVGIIAQNHLGKSALLDIIIYTLFDKFTRKGTAKDIMNIRSETFNIKLDLAIGNWTYTIVKRGIRGSGKTSTVTTKIEFYRKHDVDEHNEGIVENLEEDNTTKTKDLIKDYFGCYEDIIHTSFSVQHDNSCFVDAENTERRKELQRIMKFDIIDKLESMAGTQLTKYKDIREHISKKIDNDFIVTAKKNKLKATQLLAIHTENKDYAKEKMKQIHQSILDTSSKLNNDCKTFLEEHNKEDIEIEYEDLNDKLNQNKTDSIKLLSNIYQGESNESFINLNIQNQTQKLVEEETAQNLIIKDATKKIKLLDKSNEDLYSSKKPSNIKIPSTTTPTTPTNIPIPINPENYLSDLKSKYYEKIKNTKQEIKTIQTQITELKEKEKHITTNNETILTLEKSLVKLPAKLLELSDTMNMTYNQDNYSKALQKWLESIWLENITSGITINNNKPNVELLTTHEYKNYESKAKTYFLAKEIETYKLNVSNDATIIKQQQNQLTQDNSKLKNELKQIPLLEEQIKEITNKISLYNTKIEQIENDLSNLEHNKKIEDDLKSNKLKKNKYEKRISDTEECIKHIRTRMSLLVKYETLQRDKHYIETELKQKEDLLTKFDKYKDQITHNSLIQKDLDLLKAELADFEEVMEEIEKQYNTENTNITKYSALLDQIRKDLAEHKSIEKSLKIFEIYKKAMKQLPYILLNKIQPLLEKKVNDLLSIITDFTVKFDISDSKIDIYIDRPMYNKNNNKTIGSGGNTIKSISNSSSNSSNRYILINNGSGFERFISSLSIRIALLDISNLPKINFLAIDEGFSAFDTHNINNVGQILDYLKTKFDFILTISHLTQIKENSDIIIGLQKDENGYTKIIQ
jgi:DNA repair exonuclease SbcCD ATPase subunit